MANTASNSHKQSPGHEGQPSAPEADVLMSRWRAATAQPLGVFWPREPRWHRDAATSAPAAAGSLDRLQGLHPC
jgi:hypothetical protein